MSIHNRISKIIEYTQLTQKEFADAIDTNPSKISHILNERNGPSLEIVSQIKTRFPEINWDWIVFGKGEMLQSEEKSEEKKEIINEKEQKEIPTPLPNLFSMIDDNFEERIDTSSEFNISTNIKEETTISDSQPLENVEKINIKKIVIFYDNGKFECYEP